MYTFTLKTRAKFEQFVLSNTVKAVSKFLYLLETKHTKIHNQNVSHINGCEEKVCESLKLGAQSEL